MVPLVGSCLAEVPKAEAKTGGPTPLSDGSSLAEPTNIFNSHVGTQGAEFLQCGIMIISPLQDRELNPIALFPDRPVDY